jgi:LmbE family N-acetylglucosaminyl deacetylase
MRQMTAEGHDVTVVVATRGWAPLFPKEQVDQVRAESSEACRALDLQEPRFLDLPVTKLHEIPEAELNKTFADLFDEVRPDWVFLPFPGDRHEDHRQVFDACMVALRPSPHWRGPRMVLCYETVSETHWTAAGMEPAFSPQYWVDISDHIEAKCLAMRRYASQVRSAPDARSIEAIRALATWRGSVIGVPAAEAFMVVRGIHNG